MPLRNITVIVLTPEQWREVEREDRRVASLLLAERDDLLPDDDEQKETN